MTLWLIALLAFGLSCLALYFSGEWVVNSMVRLAKFLGWKEFAVAFLVMALAASLPNFLVGLTAAARGIPQLSFGDVVGNNLVAMTLAVALAVLFSRSRLINTGGKTTQTAAVITGLTAALPVLLTFDGALGRADGVILLLAFLLYLWWFFGRRERFSKTYNHGEEATEAVSLAEAVRLVGKIVLGVALLFFASQAIVWSSVFFAAALGIKLMFVGVLILGFGNALPEVYFAVSAARRGKTSLIMGTLMGSVIIPSTLVLGTVAAIAPIVNFQFNLLVLNRFFVIATAILFFAFTKTKLQIGRNEALFLLGWYLVFLVAVLAILE